MTLSDFIVNFGNLKRTVRTGWLNRGVSKAAVESVADHVSRTMLIALIIADTLPHQAKVRKDKLLTMALFHDLAEVYLKDIDREAWRYINPSAAGKEKMETAAVKDVMTNLSPALRMEYSTIWKDYRKRRSLEARIVEAADKLELIFQAYDYVRHGIPAAMVKDMVRAAGVEIQSLNLTNADELFREIESKISSLKNR